jgi:hypothetical protein
MKNFYVVLLFSVFTSLFADIYAQCEGITLESLTNPGPHEVATLTEVDGIRNGPGYAGATIYYPVNATPPFASIAIVPGYTAAPSSVQAWGPFYASHGIVTIIIGTNSIFEFPEARANALLDALVTIKQENVRAASPLFGALNLNQLAVSGWSMGGGGAQRAAVLDNTVAGVVALCPWLPSPQLNHQSPVLILSGQADTTAPPPQHANIHYSVTPNTTDKLLFEVANGNHSVANTPSGGNGVLGKIALSWLKLNVEGNECYCTLLKDALLVNPPAASLVQQNFSCTSLGINNPAMSLGFYPNPTRDLVYLNINEDVSYQLISALGQIVIEGTLTGANKQVDLSKLPTGMYYLNIKGQVIKLIKYN